MHQIFILIADDDEDDRAFVRQAVEQHIKNAFICEATNGDEALHCLTKEGGRLRADLVLLDLNMPLLNGFEVLTNVRASPELKHTPIAILSTGNQPEQIRMAYQKGVNCYIQKPATFTGYHQIIQSLKHCFLDAVQD